MRKVDTPLVLWADALCIHQSDDHEKSLQVGIMFKVYGNADRVLGWLGPANETYMNALRVLEVFGTEPTRTKVKDFGDAFADMGRDTGVMLRLRQTSNLKSLAAEIARDVSQGELPDFARRPQSRFEKAVQRMYAKHRSQRVSWAMETIFGPLVSSAIVVLLQNNTFFFRTWIYQELALAEQLNLVCGDCSYDGVRVLDGLDSFVPFLGPFRNLRGSECDKEETILWARTGDTIVRLRSSLRNRHPATAQSLLDLIISFSGAGCADRRDRVFALLAMTTDPLVGRNTADYSLSTVQVASRLTRTHVDETQSLDILHLCGRGNAPSWTMDLGAVTKRRYVKGSSLGCKYHTVDAIPAKVTVNGAALPDSETLQLAGIHLHTISNIACLCENPLRNRKVGPFNEWWRLAKSVGYEELEFWLALLAVPRESHHDKSDSQRQRESVRAWLGRDSNDIPRKLEEDLDTNVGHKMSVTDSGWLGFCGEHAKEGDQVCVLFGGDTPYILRPMPTSDTRSQYTLVEPCYLHGLMEGDLMHGIKTGEYEEKVFALV